MTDSATDSVARDFGRLHVVKITGTLEVREGASRSLTGTGFAIREGLVATALHVVADRRCDPPALLDGLTLSFATCGSGNSIDTFDVDSNICLLTHDVEEDWALLSFDCDRDYATLVPRSRTSVGDTFRSHGFAHPDGLAMSGEFVGRTGRKNQLLMQLRVDELTAAIPGTVRGYSGAPVMVAEHVVGIITLRNPAHDGEDHPELAVGATLFATPIGLLRDESDQSICCDILAADSPKDAIKDAVLPLLMGSPAFTAAVLATFEPDYRREPNDEVRASDAAAEAVSDTPRIEPLLDAAESAASAGVSATEVRNLLRHALQGCAEYRQIAERFGRDLRGSGVAVLEFPVSTLPNAEIVMAVSRPRPVALKYDDGQMAGESLVRVSDFRLEAAKSRAAHEGDALFVSAVCQLASRFQAEGVEPAEVHAFLQRVRNPPGDWVRKEDRIDRILRTIDNAIGSRKRGTISPRRPPFYVAVARAQKAGMHTIKQFLPSLDVGVLSPDPTDIEYFVNDVLLSLFAPD